MCLKSCDVGQGSILPLKFPSSIKFVIEKNANDIEKKKVEDPGIDPGTSRMLGERSTI